MVLLDPQQERNFRAALAVADDYAEANGVDKRELRNRVAFVMWTEGRGYNWANDGSNKSNSPGFDKHPEWPAKLRRSLDMPHDKVGNNGRSTGCTQALSEDVDGSWLSMAETMHVPTMIAEFCRRVRITNEARYAGTLLKPGGGAERVVRDLSSPVAADVLRIQQPLINEALSSNYDASQVATAVEIAEKFKPTEKDWFTMAANNWDEAVQELKALFAGVEDRIADKVLDRLKVKSEVNGAELSLPQAVAYINKDADRLAQANIVHSRVPNGDEVYPNTPKQTLGQLTEWTNLEVHELNSKVDQLLEIFTATEDKA